MSSNVPAFFLSVQLPQCETLKNSFLFFLFLGFSVRCPCYQGTAARGANLHQTAVSNFFLCVCLGDIRNFAGASEFETKIRRDIIQQVSFRLLLRVKISMCTMEEA